MDIDSISDLVDECPVCLKLYDSDTKRKRRLKVCGHKLCEECLQKMLNRNMPRRPKCKWTLRLDSEGAQLAGNEQQPTQEDIISRSVSSDSLACELFKVLALSNITPPDQTRNRNQNQNSKGPQPPASRGVNVDVDLVFNLVPRQPRQEHVITGTKSRRYRPGDFRLTSRDNARPRASLMTRQGRQRHGGTGRTSFPLPPHRRNQQHDN
jgi:hypothetical protein